MKVLFASSEIFPHAKSGGLADVSAALPHAIKEFENISKVMPLYGFIDKKALKKVVTLEVNISHIKYDVVVYSKLEKKLLTYFIEAPLLSDTQNLYGDENGDYANNDLRFAIFCSGVVALSLELGVDVVHLNDWHTALVALYIKDRKLDIKTVFTIHNLAYQGIFEFNSLRRIGIDDSYFNIDELEFYGKINFLKAGIAFCDALTTVSPTYAKEILTKEFGCGLDGFLTVHKSKLSGILNGIDTTLFNPKTDKCLVSNFDTKSLKDKHKNKVNFIKRLTLKDPRKPLFVMVTRLVEQKGIDLVLFSLKKLLKNRLNFFMIGEGDNYISTKLENISKEYDNFEFFRGYDEGLSHMAYASADFLLMPSRFEPCGLNQFIAMRYGTIPIIHSVGGLKDSVFEDSVACGNGIVFEKFTQKEFLDAVDRALSLKKDSKKFIKIKKANMECDFSFSKSALKYIEIYKKILA